MEKSVVTIAIPTWNRNARVNTNLRQIAGSLTSDFELLIIDNASDVAVSIDEDICKTLVERRVPFRIVRNPVNIGGGANILRCFEHAQTEWLLLCGDDDDLIPSALPSLMTTILAQPGVALIKFSSHYQRYDAQRVLSGAPAFLNKSGDFNNLLFMSSYIFNLPRCLPYLRFGYLMNGAYAPHVAIAVLAAHRWPVLLSDIEGVKPNLEPPSWSPIDVVLSSYELLNLPLDALEREALRARIYGAHNVGRELVDICELYRRPQMRADAVYMRRKAWQVHNRHGSGGKRVLALMTLAVIPFTYPAMAPALTMLYQRATGRPYRFSFKTRHANL